MAHSLILDEAAWASPWRGRSVRDKAVLSGGLLVLSISLPPWPGAVACGLATLVLLLGPARIKPRQLAWIMSLPLLSIFIGVATVAVSVSWDGGIRLALPAAGLLMARDLALRATAAVLAMFLLATTTPMIDIFGALRKARVPAPLVEVASLIYRMTFGLLDSIAAIHEAQAARLGYATRRAGMRSAAMAVTAVFVRALTRAQRLEVGLAGRGFEESLVTLDPGRVRSTRFLVGSAVLLAVLAVVGVVGVVIPGGGR